MPKKSKKEREDKNRYDVHFPPINATPEQVAKALFELPPDHEWEYLKEAEESEVIEDERSK